MSKNLKVAREHVMPMPFQTEGRADTIPGCLERRGGWVGSEGLGVSGGFGVEE